MKKAFFFTVVCILCNLFTVSAGYGLETAKPQNIIEPKLLTQEQEDILRLFDGNFMDMLVFYYEVSDEYPNLEIWVEVYKFGELVDSQAAELKMYGRAQANGEIAVVINQTPDYQWILTIDENERSMSNRSELNPHYYKGTDAYSRTTERLLGPISVENNKEIVLYVSRFTTMGTYATRDIQDYSGMPGRLLDNYCYTHIVKCKFSK